MINISEKGLSIREAKAVGLIKLRSQTIQKIKDNQIKKGDVLENAKLAAVMGAKKVPEMVFMAHPVQIQSIETEFRFLDDSKTIKAKCTVKAIDRTGVEIEALLGVMNALLAIFDMVKGVEKDHEGQYPLAEIFGVRIVHKRKTPVGKE